MKKKLLLSFAVFATALSVNAQKRVASNRVHKEYKVNYSNEADNFNSSDVKTESFSVNLQAKRGIQKLTDTSNFFGLKASYASPRSNGSWVAPVFFKDSIDLATVFQIIPNNTPIILKGIMTRIVSVNPNGSDVQVKVYDMKTGATLAKAQKTVAYSASSMFNVGFVFDKPYNTSGDVLLSIEPANVKDSFYVSNSGAYKNSSITCNVTGNKLTLVSPAPSTNLGVGFFVGQEVTGAGIASGTKIIGFNSTSKEYTISSTLSSPLTSVVLSGVNLEFKDLANNAGFMYLKFPANNGVVDFSKAPKEASDALIWEKGTDGKWAPKDANLAIYPIVEYDFESSPIIDNNCLGINKTVNVTYSNTNAFSIAKNPLLNKMSFWTKYVGYNKKSGYFHSRAFTSSKSYFDTLDNNASAFKFLYTAISDTTNDTLRVIDVLLPYGFYKNPGTKGFVNTFLLSSKLSSSNQVTLVPTANVAGKAVVSAKGGFKPYTYAWSDAAKTTTAEITATKGDYTATVTDANGCTSKTVAQIWIASVENLAITGLSIYPNPTANELNVTFNAKSNATIELVNVTGQVVAVKTANEFANVTFNTADLNAGVYFVNITVAEGTFTQKVIKE